MQFDDVTLPSSRKFGFFFSAVFLAACFYFFYKGVEAAAYIFASLVIAFFLISVVKADLLLPVNKLWMRFGFVLGIIVNPIVWGGIFYGVFTPIAFLMRLAGRDELRMRKSEKTSHWIRRDTSPEGGSFKHQF